MFSGQLTTPDRFSYHTGMVFVICGISSYSWPRIHPVLARTFEKYWNWNLECRRLILSSTEALALAVNKLERYRWDIIGLWDANWNQPELGPRVGQHCHIIAMPYMANLGAVYFNDCSLELCADVRVLTPVWYENLYGVVIRPDISRHKHLWSG